MSWLKEGDINSKFFHTKASSKRRYNRMESLMSEDGSWVEGTSLDDHIVGHFQKLFLASKAKGSREFLDSLGARVTESMKEKYRNFTAE